MKKSAVIWSLVFAATMTPASLAHAADGLPWHNFYPALIIFPLLFIWIAITSVRSTGDEQSDSEDAEKDE